jgi:hypothetical protein
MVAQLGLYAPAASADEIDTCLEASEAGQRAQQKARLTLARDAFQTCSRAVCPSLVRQNCARFYSDVIAILPTVTLVATDSDGRDVADIHVRLDGEALTDHLDGKAIAIDPGVHVFRFEQEGSRAIEERLVMAEGDKARKVAVRLDAPSRPKPPVVTPPRDATLTRTSPGTSPERGARGGNSALPWVLIGVGAAAAVTGLVLRQTGNADYPDNCVRGNPGTCAENTAIADALTRQNERRERTTAAENAENREIAGLWTLIGGGSVLLGGIVWLVVERATSASPSKAKAAHVSIAPSIGLGTLSLHATF